MTPSDFIRSATPVAARLAQMGHAAAAQDVLWCMDHSLSYTADDAAPISHYRDTLREAITDAFGPRSEAASLSYRQQEEAVRMWAWWEEVTGEQARDATDFDRAWHLAVCEMRAGGHGWRGRMRDVLGHSVPEYFQ